MLVILLAGGASAAQAASFYWYGENNSTCWQVGELGSPRLECDSVGAGYLPTPGNYSNGLAHMLEDESGGINEDFSLSPSGDYCTYYRIGGAVIDQQDSTNEGPTSGFTTPTPYSSYQEGDKTSGAYNACQADGTDWGQVMRGASGKGCGGEGGACGMKHYVSLAGLNGRDRPFDSRFGSPSLRISTEAWVHTLSGSSEVRGGWGFVCPELEDTTTHGVLEYCLEEWRGAKDEAKWKTEHVGQCDGRAAEIISYFSPGASLATEISGSANTFEVGPTGGGHYEAGITEANLVNAINLANASCAGWGISTTPANYALIGVEQGIEAWDVSAVGAYSQNLQLRTEYTPRPPTATTEPATEVHQYQAKLNGLVNADGVETKYHYEYGTTTSYGSSTAEASAGAGTGNVSKPEIVASLLPTTTYHYRLVAKNLWGTSWGSDQTFTTPRAARPAIMTQSSTLSVVWRGSDGNMYDTDAPPEKEWESWSPTWSKKGVPAGVVPVGNPTIITQSSRLEIVWRGSDGNIYVTDAPPEKEWESWSPTWSKKGIPSGVTMAMG
ncbi:MAG TPA: hypothetical protein VMU32_05630 [Solirubrobacteraceae bacterium]|nr:hypothetical protein [Solirubrobacteraceae bacterium]